MTSSRGFRALSRLTWIIRDDNLCEVTMSRRDDSLGQLDRRAKCSRATLYLPFMVGRPLRNRLAMQICKKQEYLKIQFYKKIYYNLLFKSFYTFIYRNVIKILF